MSKVIEVTYVCDICQDVTKNNADSLPNGWSVATLTLRYLSRATDDSSIYLCPACIPFKGAAVKKISVVTKLVNLFKK